LAEVLSASFGADAAAVLGAELALGGAVARAAALSAHDVALANGAGLTPDVVAAESNGSLAVAADVGRTAVGAVAPLERIVDATELDGAVATHACSFALHASGAVATARETGSTRGRAADSPAGERRRTGGQAAFGIAGASLAPRQIATAVDIAFARGPDTKSLERTLQRRLALAEAAAEVVSQSVGIVATDVVVGTVDGGASCIGGRRFGAAPGGTALLAHAVAGGVTTNRRAIGTRNAMTFTAVCV
jgi:hypothetical protein